MCRKLAYAKIGNKNLIKLY